MQKRFLNTFLKLLCLSALFVIVSGCSGFNRAWKAELAKSPTYGPDDLSGAWQGTWLSDVNGHNGRLRALITANPDGSYRAWYHAKYKRILSYAYSVDVETQDIPGGHSFLGEADLGKLAGGVYSYEGTATNGIYYATYKAKYDRGIFKMKRPSSDK